MVTIGRFKSTPAASKARRSSEVDLIVPVAVSIKSA